MEIMETNFTITLGSWRFCLRFAIEDTDAMPQTTKPFAKAGFSNEKPSLLNVKR
jgi:hypothetical protein